MEILVLTTAYEPLTGGAELAVKYIVENLPHHKFTVLTAKQKQGLASVEKKGHITIHRLGLGYGFDRHIFPFFALLFFFYKLKTKNYKLAWSMMANQAGYAAFFIKKVCGLPYLLSLQEGDSEAWFAKREKLPLYRAIYTNAKKIQAISQFLKNRAMKYGLVAELTVVANGYDESVFMPAENKQALREQLGLPKDALVFITASRLVEKNGVDLAIKAYTSYMTHRSDKAQETYMSYFLIAGDGSLRTELETQAKDTPTIRFLGNLEHKTLVKYMQASDVFIRLSRSEGLGSVFLEAAAVGLPVIATPVGGIPDVVKHEETGLLVSPDEASVAMLRMENTVLREKLTRGSLEFAKDFTWKKIADQINFIFTSFL